MKADPWLVRGAVLAFVEGCVIALVIVAALAFLAAPLFVLCAYTDNAWWAIVIGVVWLAGAGSTLYWLWRHV